MAAVSNILGFYSCIRAFALLDWLIGTVQTCIILGIGVQSSAIIYNQLSCEDERVPAEPVVVAMVIPPIYVQQEEEGCNAKLPSYVEATTLPSYEEAEQTKAAGMAKKSDVERQDCETPQQFTDVTIGTDGMFLCTFILSFLFNWIGFLLSLCVSPSLAGRCGALSGLGLSIVKWVAIVKHQQWADGFAKEDSIIWWLLILCGFMIFVRGAVQYVQVKYEWSKFSGQIRRYYMF